MQSSQSAHPSFTSTNTPLTQGDLLQGEQYTAMEDLDDLLGGLGSDDLDFQDLDDVGDAQEQEEYVETDPFLAPADLATCAPVFATARGMTIPPPSTTALTKIRKLFDEEPELVESLEPKRPRLEERTTSLFTTGSGGIVPRPSTMAMANAAKLLAEDVSGSPSQTLSLPGLHQAGQAVGTGEGSTSFDTPLRTKQSGAPLFTTGAGSAVAPASRQAKDAVSLLFGESNVDADTTRQSTTSGFQTGSGQVMHPPNKAAMARAMAIFGDEASTPLETSTPNKGEHVPYATPFRAPTASVPNRARLPRMGSPAPQTHPTSQRAAPDEFSTPSRAPLQTTTNTFTQSRELSRQVVDLKTPMRRIGLGSTPGSVRGKARRGFVTPFKAPGASLRGSAIRVAPKPERKEPVYTCLFDLTLPSERKSYREAYLHPQYYEMSELEEMGIPDEIWHIGLGNAVTYHFIADDATLLTNITAYDTLRRDGAKLATQKWVDNHYSMILWKLAGQALAKPELFNERWRWSEVIAQLKYRYESEYGSAQRPIIRRICEHDSSPSVPIVLCISAIHHPPPSEDEQGNKTAVKPFLELTDGWYRINAEVDECLMRAITTGKIAVGRKLAMSGSRLESGSDGEDVLDALGTTRLVLSGNSCHLARWDTKLGVQLAPFVAGLSSLTLDGGPVVLMDITVIKMYPLAYMSGEKGSREAPWGEDEERTKQDQWKERHTNERTRLHEQMRKQLELVEDLTNTLGSYAQEVEQAIQTSPPETVEQDFERLLSAKDANARIRAMPDSNIVHLATYAQQRMQSELVDGQAEVDSELEVSCPQRQVRDFRIVRVVDAQRGGKEPARVGMLNVWEAKALGEGMLQEGKRYLVSNLAPAKTGDWSLPKPGDNKEIYLHTRRDTRWKMIEQTM